MLGLLIFAGFTMFDFQRLPTNADIASRAAFGSVDLPGHLERLPVLPADLLQPVGGLTSSRYPVLSPLTRMLSGCASRSGFD